MNRTLIVVPTYNEAENLEGFLGQLRCHAPDADILMAFGQQVRKDFFQHTPKLKWVFSLGTGTDGITDSPWLGKDVIVTAVRGIHGEPISEMAFLHMLAFARDFRRIERQRVEKAWNRFPGTLLYEKTVGILGVGAIAEGLAPRCKAFGMRVVGISRTDRPIPGFDRIYSRANIEQAVAEHRRTRRRARFITAPLPRRSKKP